MSGVLDLVRADLRDFVGYRSARCEQLDGAVWLNANEAAVANSADADGAVRRYPEPQPARLRALLAATFGCAPAQLLAGRGSDEAIDLLVRALCRPGADAVLVTSPTFGMYAVAARLHGCRVIDVPQRDDAAGWRCDFAAIAEAALREAVKVVFLCSPGNPTGALLPREAVLALAARLAGRALVVIDEAYLDYADAGSLVSAIAGTPNVAVLRTLSKAHALAAVRIGCVIADPALIAVLQRCQAPYPLPAPCVALAERALTANACERTRFTVAEAVREREVVRRALERQPSVRRVYASQANFLLVRFDDSQAAFQQLLAAGIVVRDMRALPGLHDALRISIGTPAQNAAMLDALNARVAA